MMCETSPLPRNGRLLAVGGGREAMANDAHGVKFVKITKLRFAKKSNKKRSDVELWRESAYDSNGIGLHTGLYVLWLRYGEKS